MALQLLRLASNRTFFNRFIRSSHLGLIISILMSTEIMIPRHSLNVRDGIVKGFYLGRHGSVMGCHGISGEPSRVVKVFLFKLRRFQIDKVHKNNNSFFIIPNFIKNVLSLTFNIVHFRSRRKENSSEIPGHGIYRSFFLLFLQIFKSSHT